ncbi:MAG: hypothetical protein CEE38_05025 [Planctomycetes bacterium B3_Pla]|nr:MAG: hypothetical protein CEE38_05025 [Planctomycetes bacterium B3_Pla]
MSLIKNIQIPFKLLRLAFYLFSKYPKDIPFYFDWILSLRDKKNGQNTFLDRRPWLTYRAAKWLDSYLKPQMRVFEYGSGGSTVFFAQRVKQVVSVEHNPQWYQVVERTLYELEISNVEYILKEPEKADREGDCSDPSSYSSGFQNKFDRMSFCEYTKVIDNYPDAYFDLVLVDGRARPSCIMHAAKKVRQGAIIILDNSDRERYNVAQTQCLSNYKSVRFFGIGPYSTESWETIIFVK